MKKIQDNTKEEKLSDLLNVFIIAETEINFYRKNSVISLTKYIEISAKYAILRDK